MEITVHTDGGSRGNPGEGAVGGIINFQFSNSKQIQKPIKFGKRVGVVTNNEAEYMAVVEGLKIINDQLSMINSQREKIEIKFYLDSSLVCNQLNGKFKVKEARMRELLVKVRELEAEIGVYPTYHLIPREENKEADQLVNQALDQL